MYTATMPQAQWDTLALLTLESVRTLHREGRHDMVREAMDVVLPKLAGVVSAPVLGLILDTRMDLGMGDTRPLVALS